MNTIDSLKNKIFLASFSVGIVSTVAVLNPNLSIKLFGGFGVGASVAGVALGELITGQSVNIGLKSKEAFEKELSEKSTQVTNLQTTVDNLVKKSSSVLNEELTTKNQEIADLKSVVAQLNTTILHNYDIRKLLEDNLVKVRETLANKEAELKEVQTSLQNVGNFSTTEAYNIVKNTYARSVKKVEALLDALIRNHPQVAEFLQEVLLEVDNLRNRFIKKLSNYEELNSFDELLDVGLSLQEEIIDRCVSLKIKGQTIVIRFLQDFVNDAVPYTNHEKYISDLLHQAETQILETQKQGEQNKRAIAQEWVDSNNEMVERYEGEFSEVLNHAKHSVSRMQTMEQTICDLNQRINELEKPQEWRSNVLDAQKVGNSIIRFYWSQGIRLDRAFINNDPYEPVLYFASSRLDDITKIEELNKFSDSVQQHVELLLEPPHFSYNGEYGLLQTKIKLAIKPKLSKEELTDKIPDCKSVVSKAKRGFLITGHPGAGKTSAMKAISQWLGNEDTMRIALNPHDDETSSFTDSGFIELNDLEEIYEAIRQLDTELKLRGEDKTRRQTLIIAIDELGRIIKDAPDDLDVMEVLKQAAVEGRKLSIIILLGNHSQTTKAIEMDAQFRGAFYQLFLVGGATDKVNGIGAPALKQHEINWINSVAYPVLTIFNGRGVACQHPTHWAYKEYQDSGNPPMGLEDIDPITVTLGNQLYSPSMIIERELLSDADKSLIIKNKDVVNLKTTSGISTLIETVKGVKASKSEEYKRIKEAVLEYLKTIP
ncbi:MAG: AAA family ATPase [Brasilonema angustatum HA4187-MV1]|jgi:energy-coupling factor transporter ATP-binding protein EcfA2/septal ring factor EnvC (AmiA/AmiB activator)|nr:AAA family ATPase [Brasilonema angustatum HA4187-MV1]